jgi:hypothetical protein
MNETQNHLSFNHFIWKQHIKEGAIAVDATCGNGHDALFLAPLVTKLYALDIQEDALKNTKELLKSFSNVSYHLQCHSTFPQEVITKNPSLIVYNLGYLPKGNKSITTRCNTTLQSIENALSIIHLDGMISITLYPGHDEGKKEEEGILDFVKKLDKKLWTVSHHSWINRRLAPNSILIQRPQWSPKAQ